MTVSTLVSRERARMRLALAAQGFGVALAVGAVLLAIAALVLGNARWIGLPAVPLLAWLVVLLVVAVASWWTGYRLHRRASRDQVAAAIERERQLRAGALRGALEVGDAGALGRRAADSLARRLADTRGSLAPSTQRHLWVRGAVAGGAALIGVLALGAARTASPDGWRAIRHPVGAFTGGLLEPIRMLDAPPTVLRGERVRLTIVAPHRRSITLSSRATGRPWRAEALPVSDDQATVQLGPVDADLTLVAGDGRVTSDTITIRVTDRPFVGDVAIRAHYPAYLGRASEVLPSGEAARVPRGTVLAIRGRASVALREIALVREADTVRLAPDEHAFSGRLSSPSSGRWTWMARGEDGAITDVPPPLDLEIVADSAPVVEILAPQRDTVVMAQDRMSLRAAATDDHGVASVVMRSWRVPEGGQAMPPLTQAVASPGESQWLGDVPIELAPRGLEPGDELHVIIEATDASPWGQVGASRELIVRVPSLRERRELARALADSAVARAQAAARDQKALEQRTGEAARSRSDRTATDSQTSPDERTAEQMSFENAERNRSLAREQQQLQERVEQLQRDAQALEEQLRAANSLDSALARQLQDVQRQLAEALTPAMREQLEKLQQATKDLSSDQARKSLSELQEEQRRLREQLERTAEMLERAALEGAMETLHDDAQELAERERAVADSMARGEQQAAQRESEQMAREAEQLQQRIEEIAERLKKEEAEAGPSKLEEAAKNAEQSAEAMERAAQGGQQQQQQQGGQQQADNRQAGSQQQRAQAAQEGAERMEQAAQQLADARQQQVEEWKEELTSELDQSIQELVQLSREQQALAEQARQGAQPEQLRAQQGAVQQGTEKVGERLQQQAGKSAHVSPQSQGAMGEAQRKVQAATEQVAQQQRGNGAAESMEEAARALNQAAASLVRDRERAANAQSASGMQEMLERMQQLAQQQGQLNAQTSSILPMPGTQASEQARMLAARQRQLARQLEEAGESDQSGRSDALAREMRQIAEALQQGRLDASVIDRQERLFRRLLDAGLSLQKEEREEQGERESTAATTADRFAPGGEGRGREATRFREPDWNELRGLTAEERRAVLEYFKRLNAERP